MLFLKKIKDACGESPPDWRVDSHNVPIGIGVHPAPAVVPRANLLRKARVETVLEVGHLLW